MPSFVFRLPEGTRLVRFIAVIPVFAVIPIKSIALKKQKHAIAKANYVPVSGVAVGPIKLITLAIVENCVIKCVSKEPYSVSPKALYCRAKKSEIAHTHTQFYSLP